MEIIEYIIWFATPITLSVIIGMILKNKKRLSIVKLLVAGVVLGVFGVALAPTTLCTSLCDKIINTFVLSLVINTVLLYLVILWINVRVK